MGRLGSGIGGGWLPAPGHDKAMTVLAAQADLENAVGRLVAADDRLAPVLARAGMPALRRREPGFTGLAHIVTGQQLSTAAAAAVWGRVVAGLGAVTPETVLAASDEALGGLGLSRAKVRSMKAIAAEVTAGRLDLDALATLAADAAHGVLTALLGIGPWTADVYLLFCLGHADAWPAGDLAVQEAVRVGLGLPARPGNKQMAGLAEPWRPFRGAAAHLWWGYYAALKQREGVLVG